MGTVNGAKQKCRSGGLSLGEVVLSLGLLTIIAITVAGVFTHLLNASAKTNDLTAGRLLAQQLLDKAVRESRTTRHEGQVELKTHHSDTLTKFFYVVEPSILDPGINDVDRDFYFVEVEVSWFTDNPDHSTPEMGRLSTKISQTVGYKS